MILPAAALLTFAHWETDATVPVDNRDGELLPSGA